MLVALMAALLTHQLHAAVPQFSRIAPADVPAELFASNGEPCDGREPAECRREFLAKGGAWAGDLNEDGVREILLASPVLSGTGGMPYYIFQQRQQSWEPLAANGGFITLTNSPRFDILPKLRGGYHDIRVGVVECFKWNGNEYVRYETADFRALLPAWFESSRLDEAELLWTIRYRGQDSVAFEPQWFQGVPEWSRNVEVDDPAYTMQWVAMFKGGVYGVQGPRCFLLLPLPAYRGAERLQIDGEWLVIDAVVTTDRTRPRSELQPVARYNRRTRELRVLSHDR